MEVTNRLFVDYFSKVLYLKKKTHLKPALLILYILIHFFDFFIRMKKAGLHEDSSILLE